MNGIVFDIKKYAIHDGPGVRTTVFLKGCPLNCSWCHNPESINPKVEEIIKINRKKALNLSYSETKEIIGREISTEEVFNEVKKDSIIFEEGKGGVTFSGGEPLMQADFLKELLVLSKNEDFHTCVDTSGMATWSEFAKIKDYVNLFLFDLKVMDESLHKEYTGVSNKQILENLIKLTESGSKVRIRIPLIPDITDTPENIDAVIEFISKLKNIVAVDILPFNTIYEGKYTKMNMENKLGKKTKQTKEKLNNIKNQIEAKGFEVMIGG